MARLRGVLHDPAQKAWKSIKGAIPAMGAEEKEEEGKYGKFQIESASASLVAIPETDEITEVDFRYPLLEPFAEAHIYWDSEEEELIYEIEEPSISEREEEIFEKAKNALEKKISVPLSSLEGSEEIANYLKKEFEDVLDELGFYLDDAEKNKLMYYVYRNFGGLNEIEPLMNDPYIEDIGCSGIGIPVYIIHTKFGSIKTDLKFEDEEPLKNLVVKLAERADKYVSYSDPLLDGTLPDGSRVNASLTADVTTKGPTFSIRKFQEVPFSAVDLLELGTADTDIMAYMWMALQYQKSALIIGGTATGKTTFLNSIVSFIPPEMKITSIEDTRELQLPHENWIPSVTRSAAGQQEQDITMYELLRESFRQNPDYVVVGEVRGEEASVLFQGMASGHPSISTMHASSPSDVVSRLTTEPINLSPALVNTLDMIISMTHAREWGENARRVKSIYEIEDVTDEGSARTNEYFSWTAVDDTFAQKQDSNVLDSIQQQYGLGSREIQQEIRDRKKVLEWLHDQGYTHFEKVSSVVSEYYKDKPTVMDLISEETQVGFEDIVEESEADMPPEIERETEKIESDLGKSPKAEKDVSREISVKEEDSSSGEPRAGDRDYSELVQEPVEEVKDRVEEEGLEPDKVLEAERKNKDRATLVEWLEEQAGGGDQEGSEGKDEISFGEGEVEENPFE